MGVPHVELETLDKSSTLLNFDDQSLESGAVHVVRVVVYYLPKRILPEAAHDHHDRGAGGRDHLPPAHRVLVSLLQKGHYYTLSGPQLNFHFIHNSGIISLCQKCDYNFTDKGSHTQNQCFWVYHLSVQNVITNIQTKAVWQHIKSMLMCLTFLCNKGVKQFTGKIRHKTTH